MIAPAIVLGARGACFGLFGAAGIRSTLEGSISLWEIDLMTSHHESMPCKIFGGYYSNGTTNTFKVLRAGLSHPNHLAKLEVFSVLGTPWRHLFVSTATHQTYELTVHPSKLIETRTGEDQSIESIRSASRGSIRLTLLTSPSLDSPFYLLAFTSPPCSHHTEPLTVS